MKKIINIVLFLFVLNFGVLYASVEVPESIKIGLYTGSDAVSSITLSSKSGMQIGTINKKGKFCLEYEIKENEFVTVSLGKDRYSVNIKGYGEIGDKDNFVRFIPNSSNDVALIKVSSSNYRGEIEINRIYSEKLAIINEVSMQEYLYGVVPREIGGKSPDEALKAQAIIARTYAIKNYDKRKDLGCNLLAKGDQAYGGYDWEHPNSNAAVDETDGMVVTYNGEAIGSYFYSTSGGYTESSENVWSSEIEYLKAVPDPYEDEIENETEWTVTLTSEDVEKLLSKNNINIGSVNDIVITKTSDAGRVLELKIIGTSGTHILTKSNARTFFGLRSQWFTVNDDAPVVPKYNIYTYLENIDNNYDDEIEENISESKQTEIKPLLAKVIAFIKGEEYVDYGDVILATDDSNNANSIFVKYSATKKASNYTNTFIFRGRGYGHSIGLSQNGAIGMAKNGFTYDEIIKWYYTGVEIEY